MSTKEPLNVYVRETLIARHGSLAFAAERLGISYERLKKAIQRNRFSASDLESLLPERSYEDWAQEYDFHFSRRHGSNEAPASASDADGFKPLFATLEAGFRSFQRGVRDIDFGEFVDELYKNIGSGSYVNSMVIFCHDTSQPVEWRPEQIHLLNRLGNALCSGAMIIYVMECDLENTVTPEPLMEDNVDRHFKRHIGRLKSMCTCGNVEGSHKGFVALLRVPRCAFCIPYQKPALFSHYDGGDAGLPEHYALTTIEVPERIDGQGALGTAVLPLQNVVAHAMRDFLFDLVGYIKSKGNDSPFHSTCYPEADEEQLVKRLQPLVDL